MRAISSHLTLHRARGVHIIALEVQDGKQHDTITRPEDRHRATLIGKPPRKYHSRRLPPVWIPRRIIPTATANSRLRVGTTVAVAVGFRSRQDTLKAMLGDMRHHMLVNSRWCPATTMPIHLHPMAAAAIISDKIIVGVAR